MVPRMGVKANYFRGGGTLVFVALAVFRPVVTASTGTGSTGAVRTASTRSTNKIISISAVYWEYGAYSDHLSVYRRFDNIIRILLQTAFIVGGWSHEWELKQITFGRGTRVFVLAVSRPVVTASNGAASTSSTRSSAEILSTSAVLWEYEVYSDHLSTHRRFDISSAFYCREHIHC